ncbi:hypothetical protein SAMN04488063_1347 [Halopelagius inordinatus]|uniref:Uncharacterized protein n=1 Tax=Halopelagius inordinatus TaxID=553467 RepID=A0A1I2NV15_9EURY|nr:hypothetical protein [Halopelagius inordinatus]SFG07588.1 hypothetical protein SAMN04488063_1347 [Halopelagius inordinatus]
MNESEETDVRTCIDLYTTVWDLFRTRTFGREELGRTLLERDGHRRVAADADLRAVLSRLVEFGLLETRPDGFRVAVRPDDVAAEMPESASLRTEAVRRLVRSSLGGDSTDGDGDPTLSRDDESYAVVELGADEAVTSGVRRVASAAEGSDHRGVVVATPGTNADAAQRVGDRLTEKHREWEKAGSNVVTGATDDDELVFRLYLDYLPDESGGE